MYLYIKALHIIFVVTWFSGLFYIVRLFIYFAEASEKGEPEKSILQDHLKIQQKRLWYAITWPSAVLTAIFGPTMWYLYGSTPDWLMLKLLFVLALYIYHFICHSIFKQQQNGIVKYRSYGLRIWNEVTSLILFAVVFLVVLKNTFSIFYGVGGLIVFAGILMAAIRIYKLRRDNNEKKKV